MNAAPGDEKNNETKGAAERVQRDEHEHLRPPGSLPRFLFGFPASLQSRVFMETQIHPDTTPRVIHCRTVARSAVPSATSAGNE